MSDNVIYIAEWLREHRPRVCGDCELFAVTNAGVGFCSLFDDGTIDLNTDAYDCESYTPIEVD